MEAPELDAISLASLLPNSRSSFTSVRSSFEYAAPDRKTCGVTIFDEPTQDANVCIDVTRHSLPACKAAKLPDALKMSLMRRNEQRTRWINFTGCSSVLVDDLARCHLDDHGCLDAHNIGDHNLGGPVKRKDGGHFIWVQTSIWYTGCRRRRPWSSVQQCGFRVVVCLPTAQRAGTLITNFTGRREIVEEVSLALTTHMLEQHSMGLEAMSCVWVLTCSILRAITTELDLAFHNFDPLERICGTPDIAKLPSMLEQVNDLARIDRYTSGLDEVLEFFETVRAFQQSQSRLSCETAGPERCYARISERSNLESQLAKQKIRHARQLCRTYMKQYDSHVQRTLSYSTAQIADRLDSGRQLGEQIAAVGIVLAAISGVTSPLAVVTGYFGMNMHELTNDGKNSLFNFWAVAAPVIALSLVVLGIIFSRLMLGASHLIRKSSLHPP